MRSTLWRHMNTKQAHNNCTSIKLASAKLRHRYGMYVRLYNCRHPAVNTDSVNLCCNASLKYQHLANSSTHYPNLHTCTHTQAGGPPFIHRHSPPALIARRGSIAFDKVSIVYCVRHRPRSWSGRLLANRRWAARRELGRRGGGNMTRCRLLSSARCV